MTTLRERVREALAANEPTDREARADLAAILARARGGRAKRSRAWLLILVPAVIALSVVIARRERPAPVARGVHLYLRAGDEPEDRALALDIDSKGDL